MTTSLITCSNKGCYSQDYHKLDIERDEVVCLDCGKDIETTQYMKKMLKSSGQIFRKARVTKEILCSECKMLCPPTLLEFQNKCDVVCSNCGHPNDHLSKYFVEALKLNDNLLRLKVATVNDEVKMLDGSPLPWNKNKKETPKKSRKKSTTDKETK